MTNTKPEVGMGVTSGIGGDSYPHTITAVFSDTKIAVRHDRDICVSGSDFTNDAKWEFQTVGELKYNPETDTIITLRKNGKWIPQGQEMRDWGAYYIGFRRSRRDPHR